MPAKDREQRRATARAWYARTKSTRRTAELIEAERLVKRARRHKLIDWLAELKDQLRCTRCGENHPGCLVFHHLEPFEKELSVSGAIQRGWGRNRVESEIAKCEVLCANCHAKHHAKKNPNGW